MRNLEKIFRNFWRWWFDDTYRLDMVRQKKIARRFQKAKKIAHAKHSADARTYYVILGPKDQYYIYNSFEIMQAKKRGIFKQKMTIHDVYTAASYVVSGSKNMENKL
jgi:hypothetical protein